MKRIFTIIPEGEKPTPILVVANNMVSAYAFGLSKISEDSRIVAVQEGPEVEIAE